MRDEDRRAIVAALEAEGLLVTEWWDEAGATYPQHTHAEREVRVVVQGSMTVTSDGTVRRLGPGDRIDLAAGTRHAAEIGPDGVRYLAGSDRGQRTSSVTVASRPLMSARVIVVTDSSAVAPATWSDSLSIHVVPLEIAWPDGTVDAGNRPFSEVADRLASASAPPKTGAPSPGSYEALFDDLLAGADGVLVVCPASELSTTFQSATLAARQRSDDRVRVLDAKTAAAGQAMVAVEAARVAAHGGDLDVVCGRALEVASRMNIWATMSRLDFLRRSGRLPTIAAIGADALHLHPIVRFAGSSPTPVAVTRSPRRAVDRIYRAWERSIPAHLGGAALHALAFHSARDAEAADLVRRVGDRAPGAEADSVEVTASLASHTGPGLLGLAWFWDS